VLLQPQESPLSPGYKKESLATPPTHRVIINTTTSIIVMIAMNYLIEIFGQIHMTID
jgi:hypothetical protein